MLIGRYAFLLFLSITAFGQDLKSEDPKERVKAVRAYREGGADTIETLKPLLSDSDRTVRLEAVRSIVAIGTQHSLDPLITATSDSDADVQIAATDGLVNFYLPGYVPKGMVAKLGSSIRGRFDRENRDVIDAWINVRPEIVEAIGKLARGGTSMESRANAARAAGILRGKAALPDLIEAMQTKDTEVLFEVLISFQKIGDPSAGPRARPLLRDLVERVQIAAIETVGLLRTEEAVPDLQRVFESSKSVRVLRAALTSLAMLPDKTNRPFFESGLADRDEGIRTAAAEGFARLNQEGDIPVLAKAFEEDDRMAPRLGNAFALVALGDVKTEEFSPLTYLVHTLNSRGYKGVVEAYLTELSRKPEVRTSLYSFVANATRDEKIGLARVLALTGDTESVAQVEWISKDGNTEVAQEGLRALKVLRTRLN